MSNIYFYNSYLSLRYDSSYSLEVVLEVSWDFACLSIVSSDSVDSRLFDSQSVLGVLVISVLLQVLSYGERFLDQVIQVLGNLRSQSILLENSLYFVS